MKGENNIGELEELILLAVQHLGDDAYGVPIGDAVEAAGRNIAVGTLYITIDRLEKKGLLEGRQSEATPERGGKSRRYFRLTGNGSSALDAAESRRARLRGLRSLAGGAA